MLDTISPRAKRLSAMVMLSVAVLGLFGVMLFEQPLPVAADAVANYSNNLSSGSSDNNDSGRNGGGRDDRSNDWDDDWFNDGDDGDWKSRFDRKRYQFDESDCRSRSFKEGGYTETIRVCKTNWDDNDEARWFEDWDGDWFSNWQGKSRGWADKSSGQVENKGNLVQGSGKQIDPASDISAEPEQTASQLSPISDSPETAANIAIPDADPNPTSDHNRTQKVIWAPILVFIALVAALLYIAFVVLDHRQSQTRT